MKTKYYNLNFVQTKTLLIVEPQKNGTIKRIAIDYENDLLINKQIVTDTKIIDGINKNYADFEISRIAAENLLTGKKTKKELFIEATQTLTLF